ncbi:beta-galactosidase [Colwelliaceae bacterium BS250]
MTNCISKLVIDKLKLTLKLFSFLLLIIANTSLSYALELNAQSIKINQHKAKASFSTNNELNIELSAHKKSKIVLLPASGKNWDFSRYHGLKIELTNTGSARFMPTVQLTSLKSEKWQKAIESSLYLEPGESKTLLVYFYITREDFAEQYPQYKKMNAGPYTIQNHWVGIDNSSIDKITFSPLKDDGYISAGGQIKINAITPFTLDQLYDYPASHQFPFVDKYGQYLHGKYPGKLTSSEQWQVREQQEQADLKANPGPSERSKYGGWLKGPKQKATGHFYTKKIDGKWWFVDPDGYLFWSHGVTGVGQKGANTLITGRENYFKNLPKKTGAYQQFYSTGSHLRFDYTMANLYRKYGNDWKQISIERNHQRLKSWGMNTYGNWSQAEDFSQEQTPFTVAVNYKANMLEEKFPDPWDKNFANNIRRSLVDKKRNEKGDSPWNIGFFIDNELHFFQSWTYAKIITSSEKNQPAKKFFVKHLKSKYQTIKQLNLAWKTSFKSFDALLSNRKELTIENVGEDGEWFYQQMVEQYYRVCSETLKSVFPNHLYLGSRVHGDTNETVLRAAEKYADVISYNLYRRSLRDFTSKAKGLTKPLMATEFHFGALDRGVFHTGLQEVSNQQERAQHYYEYVLSAVNNPLFVGTHWFQYRAQAITGRGDGENYQIGLVDITDTPYPETIEAVREIGYQLYEKRLE